MSWFCVILHLQHFLEEKAQNFTRVRQSSTPPVEVLSEAKMLIKKQNCLVENACVILHLQHFLEEKTPNFTRVRQSSTPPVEVLCEAKIFIKKQNCLVENAHQEEESFFPFSTLLISSSSAADQLSSFRVACVADRVSSRNKLKFF